MAYDDSRFREPGFREEPDYRGGVVPEDAPRVGGNSASSSIYSSGTYPVQSYPDPYEEYPDEESYGAGHRAAPSPAQLDEVFDDPEHGDPGRDRVLVHVLWEVVLLLGAGALFYLLRDADAGALKGAEGKELMLLATQIGLVAVGPIAYAAALFFADNSGRGLLIAAGLTAALAIGAGVVIAIFVAGLHVPSWAASLGAALALSVWIAKHKPEQLAPNYYDPHSQALYWFAGFVALSFVGGLIGLLKPIRRTVGRFRPVADPARRRGGVAGLVTALCLAGSSVLAAAAGVLIALDGRSVAPTENGLALAGVGIGAALLGGTSAFGRRGGILGTALAVTVIVLGVRYAATHRLNLSLLEVGAAAIGLGLMVTRLVETFGRPRTAQEEVVRPSPRTEWTPPATPQSWTSTSPSSPPSSPPSSRTSGWGSPISARVTDDGWGSEDRWSSGR
jgi:ribose/xylose/arabinose/galactoside ABC-type transport system permease subunit